MTPKKFLQSLGGDFDRIATPLVEEEARKRFIQAYSTAWILPRKDVSLKTREEFESALKALFEAHGPMILLGAEIWSNPQSDGFQARLRCLVNTCERLGIEADWGPNTTAELI